MVAKKKTTTKSSKPYKYVVAAYDGDGAPKAHSGFNNIDNANAYFEKLRNKPLSANTQSTIVLWKRDGAGKGKWEEVKSVQVAHLSWR